MKVPEIDGYKGNLRGLFVNHINPETESQNKANHFQKPAKVFAKILLLTA